MQTLLRERSWVAAAVAVALAAAATTASLLVTREPSVPEEYAPLGAVVGRMADALNLPADQVGRVKYGREFASATEPLRSDVDRLDVSVERYIGLRGRIVTTLHIGSGRQTSSDTIGVSWSLAKVIPSEDFKMSLDLERVELNTDVCDERSGETNRLSVTWTVRKRDYINYGILAARGGDATFTGRFGDEEISGDLGSANIQIWGGYDRPPGRPDGSVQLNGKRIKPVKCPPQ